MERTGARNDLPRVLEVNKKMSQKWVTGTVVIPDPMEVNDVMRSVREGKLITINQVRKRLTEEYAANFG